MTTAISPSFEARAVGVKTTFKNLRGGVTLLPQRIAVVGQGATAGTFSLDKKTVLSAFEVGLTYGFGSPLHLVAQQLFPPNGDGVGAIPVTLYPLMDGTTAASGDITPAGGPQGAQQSYIVKINEIPSEEIVIPAGSAIAAAVPLFVAGINANVDMPMIASDGTTKIDFIAKWKGASGNDLLIEIEGVVDGITYVIVQPAGGAANPDVQDALDKIGTTWETLILNCMEIADTVNLDKYSVFGEGRWLPIKPKPFIAFTGNSEASVATAIVISDARPLQRVNSQLVAPGSNNLPFVIAARELTRIALIANENPPVDYLGQLADGLVPGADIEQWTDLERDTALKAGSSSIELVDGVVNLSDTVTFFHPEGDPTPAYRYVADIVKIQNVTFSIRKIFESAEWAGAVLIKNGQATENPRAKTPSMAVAALAGMLDSLALLAIVSDPDAAKASIVANISPTNPKRLDISFTYQISGNTNQISIDANWGFFFGRAA